MMDKLEALIRMLSGFGSQRMEEVGVTAFVFVMAVSLLCSLFVAYLYRKFYGSRATGSQIHRAFPLLGVSVTAIFICIQFSLPLSLGLLGALSIVRFRTPIKEPEEIGFIMLVIAVSIASATFNFVFLGILLAGAVAACLLLRFGPRVLADPVDEGVLIVTLPNADYSARYGRLDRCVETRLRGGRLESISKSGEESVVSYNFVGMHRQALVELQQELNELVGESNYSIFFNRQGAV